MSLNYFCLHLPLRLTTTHCLSLPLQYVSDNGTSIMNVIELLLSSSSSPLHYHTLSISTTAVSKWQWHINNECHWTTFVFIFLSTSLPHIVYLYHCSSKWQWHINNECHWTTFVFIFLSTSLPHIVYSLPLQVVSDNGTSIMNVIELLLSSSSSPLHYHTLSISTTAVSKWQWHINNECHWTTFVFIFLSTSLPHIVYLYHCRE